MSKTSATKTLPTVTFAGADNKFEVSALTACRVTRASGPYGEWHVHLMIPSGGYTTIGYYAEKAVADVVAAEINGAVGEWATL